MSRPTPREEAPASALRLQPAAEPSPYVLAAARQPTSCCFVGAAAACFKQQIPRSSLQRQTTTCLRQSLCRGKAAPAAAVVPHAAQRRSVPACCAAAAAASPGAKQNLLGLLEVLDQVGHICLGRTAETSRGHTSTAHHTVVRDYGSGRCSFSCCAATGSWTHTRHRCTTGAPNSARGQHTSASLPAALHPFCPL